MNEDLYIEFENYLSNQMLPEERIALEDKLKNDTEASEKFRVYQNLTNFLEHKFDPKTEEFRQNLQAISSEHFSETQPKSKVINFKPWVYSIAATVVVFIGVWFMNSGSPEYGDFDQHEEAHFVERGAADKNKADAQKYFNAKDYKKAIFSFESIEDLTDPELQYFFAIALIETNHYKFAHLYLENLRSGTSVYKDKATWYSALSYLKQNKMAKCKAYLKQVPEDCEDYEKAQKLLKKLD